MLLNKKYSLPTPVIEGLVSHYYSFGGLVAKMPVLWHASLITFVQRYKGSLSEEQKTRILEVISVHSHHQITQEIKRELKEEDVMED